MTETLLDRFLQIKDYNDIKEVEGWLKSETDRLNNDIPKRYRDMLGFSMLSDLYYSNIPENIQAEIVERNGGALPPLIEIMESYRIAEERMLAMADWSDTVNDTPDAERARKFIYALIEDYHDNGWEVLVSSVGMETNIPEDYGELSVDDDEDAVDEFEADMLPILAQVFNDFSTEYSFQLFFRKPGSFIEKAIILVSCLWQETPDGYGNCLAGPFLVSGRGKGGIELIAPDNIGLQILTEGNANA